MDNISQMTAEEEAQYGALREQVQALDKYLEAQGLTGPKSIQVALLWVAFILRDQADMPELGEAAFELANAVTTLYRAQVTAVRAAQDAESRH